MATKGKCKLVDIHDDALRLYSALENFLERHNIPYTFHLHAEGFRRYYVNSVDLCCAQSILGALQAMARGEM